MRGCIAPSTLDKAERLASNSGQFSLQGSDGS
jgi:hypothetical protein